MNLLFRLLLVVAAGGLGRYRDLLSPSRLRLRVLPNDIDLNLHMNNARYLSIFDLGKIDILIRSGAARIAHRRRWRPLIGGNVVRYRFGLGLFQRFQLVTRILCWDEKWFYFEHRIETRRGLAALALSKALLHDGSRSVPPGEIVAALGAPLSPPVPQEITEWLSLEELLRVEAADDGPVKIP